jgi:hypothetical protein
MRCEEAIDRYLRGLHERFDCRTVEGDRLGIVTPYLYPDHDNIEVFLKDRDGQITVSDLGETLRRLDGAGLDVGPDGAVGRRAVRIAGGVGVELRSGVLLKRGALADAGKLIFDVVSVCAAVSQLVYSARQERQAETFADETERFLEGEGFQLFPRPRTAGGTGRVYHPDYGVRDARAPLDDPRPTRWLALLRPSRGHTPGRVNAVFRMWSDLGDRTRNLTFFDNRRNDPDETDIEILRRVSGVYLWKNRQTLAEALRRPAPSSSTGG